MNTLTSKPQPPKIAASGNNYFKLVNNTIVKQNSWLLETGEHIPFTSKSSAENLELTDLEFLNNYSLPKDILLVACGNSFIIPSFQLRSQISQLGFKLEWMITPSAYHIWNFIIEDYRNVVGLFFL